MTLGTAILLFGIYSTSLGAQERVAPPQSTQQPGFTSPPSSQAPQGQNGTSSPAAKPESTPSSSAAQRSTTMPKRHTAKKSTSKKTPSTTTCDATSRNSGSSGSASAPGNGAPRNPTSEAQASAATPARNCPPEKIIVRQGGAAEPSIQLAGGDQASQKRDDTSRMLGSAEANLRKIAGLQLSAAQEDTVSQIRQFIDQSKAALADGDVERGNTLAWKAQVLSEDLVKPQK